MRAAAGDGDLRGPLECRLPRGQLENGAVTGHEHGVYVLIDPSGEDVHARRLGLVNDGVRGFDHRLEAIGTDPECIVDDYLETVRLGDSRVASRNRNNAEPMLDELCRKHGTSTEGAFRDALAKFDVQAFLDAAEVTNEDRELLSRGAARSHPQTRRNRVAIMETAAIKVREASAEDTSTLWAACFEAANWRGDARFTRQQLMDNPELSHYVEGWPRPGDFGVVAETGSGEGIGAAWCRIFPADDAGYGFVATDIPELTIGVVPGLRGAGTGTALMTALIALGQSRGLRGISLSVEDGNRARDLYERLGFVRVGRNGGSDTLLLKL